MEYAIDVYGKDRRTGPIYLGRTTATGIDTVGDVETRIIRDVLAGVEGIGRTTPFEMTAVHLNGERHDDNVNFRDSTQLFTEAIKNSHSNIYEYKDFNVIIKVHDGYNSESNRSGSNWPNSESNRSSTSSNGSNSESNRRSPGRSRSRSSSTSKRGRSKSRSSSTSKRGRSKSRSTNHTRKRVTL